MGCNNGLAELEKKSSFFDSVIKIGQGFQDIFGNFGNAMGEALGFNAVKSDDTRDKVGKHFEKIGEGLKKTKDKLDGLAKEITSVSHANAKGVEPVIKNVSEVLFKLMTVITNLAGVTKATDNIGAAATTNPAVAADSGDVKTIIDNIKEIITVAENSGVKINAGNPGKQVTAGGQTDAPAALAANNNATAQSGPKLATEVAKADPWAMINKIKDAVTGGGLSSSNNKAGALATAIAAANNTGAATNADLAAAVALKAMTKTGRFSAASGEEEAIKAAASAVNKVLGVLDEIIRKTVSIELGKIKDAVEGINYSDTNGEAIEAKK